VKKTNYAGEKHSSERNQALVNAVLQVISHSGYDLKKFLTISYISIANS